MPQMTDQTQIPDPQPEIDDQTVLEEGPSSGALRAPELNATSRTPARFASKF